MKFILISLLLTIIPLLATPQNNELWIIHGRQVYFDHFPHISKVLPKHNIPEFGFAKTSNYKGYTASWAVIDNQLYLVGIVAWLKGSKLLSNNNNVIKNTTFPVKVTNWSGTVTKRNPVSQIDLDTSTIEKYDEVSMITFKNGKLITSVFDKKETNKSKTKKANKSQ